MLALCIQIARKLRHVYSTDMPSLQLLEGKLRQVLLDIQAENSNLAKSLSEKSSHAMYQDENPQRCLLSLQN